MQERAQRLADLLPYGAQSQIARKFGLSRSAVQQAIRAERPGNVVVIEAMRIARENGALETAKDLASLSA
jgi:DNA-binding transcriptional regulator LsrR (DeoR family)